ncbi:MAG: transposase [Mycoplasmatales bacterium]
MVSLVKVGKTQSEVSREYGVPNNTISQWIKKYDSKTNTIKADNLFTEEQKGVRKLKKENKILKKERDILKVAALIFSKEQSLLVKT